MAADDGARAGDRRHLDRLVAFRARPGPGNPGRRRWHADRPADARERFERAWRMTEQLGASAEVSGETPESGAPDEVNQAGEVEDLAPAPDSGSDEKPAAGEFPAVVDARPAAVVTDGGTIRRQRTMVDPDERVRDVLWGARYLVVTRYMWPTRGVPCHQQLSAVGRGAETGDRVDQALSVPAAGAVGEMGCGPAAAGDVSASRPPAGCGAGTGKTAPAPFGRLAAGAG